MRVASVGALFVAPDESRRMSAAISQMLYRSTATLLLDVYTGVAHFHFPHQPVGD
jgi:hypothetical protein